MAFSGLPQFEFYSTDQCWVPMPMAAPMTCCANGANACAQCLQKASATGRPQGSKGRWCAGFWLGQSEAFKQADHSSSRQSPPQPANPVPGSSLGGVSWGQLWWGQGRSPAFLHHSRAASSANLFRGGRPYLQPSGRGLSSRGLACSTRGGSVFLISLA